MSQYVLVAPWPGTGLCGFSRWFPPSSTLNTETLLVAGSPGLVLLPSPCSPSPASASGGRPPLSLGVLALACVPELAGLSELETSEGLRGEPSPWLCPQESRGHCSRSRVLGDYWRRKNASFPGECQDGLALPIFPSLPAGPLCRRG